MDVAEARWGKRLWVGRECLLLQLLETQARGFHLHGASFPSLARMLPLTCRDVSYQKHSRKQAQRDDSGPQGGRLKP